MPLLFPIGEKDYSSYSVIQNQWHRALYYLSRAAGITIYGYSAPASDLNAVELLKSAFKQSNTQDIAPFTIINLKKNESVQKSKWKDFFDARMVFFCESFEETILWSHPRVSLEAMFDSILQGHPRETLKPFRKFFKLEDLQAFVMGIDEFEMNLR